MTAPTAEQANNAQRTQNMKMFKKRLCFWKIIKKCICSKKHGFPNKRKIMHTYGCLGRNIKRVYISVNIYIYD